MFLSEAQLRRIIKEEITKRLRDSLAERLKSRIGKGLYVHFSQLNKKPTLRPGNNWDNPQGVYVFPLTSRFMRELTGGVHDDWAELPHAHVLQASPPPIDLGKMSATTVRKKLKELKAWLKEHGFKTPPAKDITDAFVYASGGEYASILWGAARIAFGHGDITGGSTDSEAWRQAFLDIGIRSAIDHNGSMVGDITEEAVFFEPDDLTVVETISMKTVV